MKQNQKTNKIKGRVYDINLESSLLSHKNPCFSSAIEELAFNPCSNTKDLAEYLLSAKLIDYMPLRGYGEVKYETREGVKKSISTNHGCEDVVKGIQMGKFDPSEALHELVFHLKKTFSKLPDYSIDASEANELFDRARKTILNGYMIDIAILE